MTGNFQTLFGVSLVGSGSATPAQKITNDQLAARVDTNDEWVNTRTGIRERRIIGSDESLSKLSTQAAISAIEMAGWEVDTVDMVQVAASTNPSCASLCGPPLEDSGPPVLIPV